MPWHSIGTPAPDQLAHTRLQLHCAAQAIANVPRLLARRTDDWSHSAFAWDEGRQALLSARIPADVPFYVGLRVPDATALILDADLHPESKLYLAIRTHLWLFDRLSVDTIGLGARDGTAAPLHQDMRPLYKKYQDLWTRLVTDGRAEGVFSTTGDSKFVVFAILGMCNWMGRWFDPGKPVELDEIIETFYAVSGTGLVRRPDGNPADSPLDPSRRAEIENFITCAGNP